MSTKITTPHTEEDIKALKVADLRRYALRVSESLDDILNLKKLYCHQCDDWHLASGFYADKRYKSGFYPVCKECLQKEAMDYNKQTKEYTDNREKTIKVFQKLDLPFIDSAYRTAIERAKTEAGDRNHKTAYGNLITIVKTFDQYRNLHFEDSEFGYEGTQAETLNETISKREPRKEIKKLFGSGFTTEEYLYLQDQYDDWRARTQVDSKSQETYIIRICFRLLDIWKAQRKGDDTTKLDESLNKLMDAANLQPKQNVANAATDSLTFGQLIEKWEQEKPIPEPDPELSDVSNIGKNLRVWFAGWLGHALGLNVPQTEEYEEEVAKYTVTKPEESEEGSSSAIYNRLYGSAGD